MDEGFEDLRDFLASQKEKNPEESAVDFEKRNYFKDDPDIENFISATSVTKDLKRLTERVDELEVLNYGLWLMLEKKGFTHEEFNEALAIAKDRVVTRLTTKTEAIPCPECGKALQAADIFGVRCIYCGYEQQTNPYQLDTPAVEKKNEEVSETYDVAKDLGFDE